MPDDSDRQIKEDVTRKARGGFLRKRTPLRLAQAAVFLAGCLASAVVLFLYLWPRANWLVYYFTVRPSFVWLGMGVPLIAAGAFAVRWRWFLTGCAFWLICLMATGDARQTLKLFPDRSRSRFQVAQYAYRSLRERPEFADRARSVPLRIVTWNVAGGTKGAQGAVDQLAALDPDIVFLQEIVWSGKSEITKGLRESPRLRSYHLASRWKVGVLSRFPVHKVASRSLHEWRGGVFQVEVEPGVVVTCICVHLRTMDLRAQFLRGWTVPGLTRAVEGHRGELGAVADLVEHYSREGSVILAGDFNLPPNYADLRSATAGLRECFNTNGYGWGGTVPARSPVLRIDQIYVPQNTDVFYAGTMPTRNSDHCAMVAEVALPSAGREPASGESNAAN